LYKICTRILPPVSAKYESAIVSADEIIDLI